MLLKIGNRYINLEHLRLIREVTFSGSSYLELCFDHGVVEHLQGEEAEMFGRYLVQLQDSGRVQDINKVVEIHARYAGLPR